MPDPKLIPKTSGRKQRNRLTVTNRPAGPLLSITVSNVGWVFGHSHICYGPLLHGAATVVYERKPLGTPEAGAFWRVIKDHDVVALFVAPTAFRAIRKEDPMGDLLARYDLSKFRILFLAGERTDAETIEWA